MYRDVVLLGTLPCAVLDALAQRALTCTLHGVTWSDDGRIATVVSSGAHLTLTHGSDSSGGADDDGCDVERWTAVLRPCASTTRSVRVEGMYVDSSSTHDMSTAPAAAEPASLRPCLLLDPSSWTHTRGSAAAADCVATYRLTPPPPLPPPSAAALATTLENATQLTERTTSAVAHDTHDAQQQQQQQQRVSATATSTVHTSASDTASTARVAAAADTDDTAATRAPAAPLSLRGRRLPQLLRDDRALLCAVAQYLAPAPRTSADVVAHVCSLSAHAARYTAADVAYIVRLLTRTTPRGTCELHGAGYALVDVEAYDSKRSKQMVANRAFAELAGHAGAQALLRRMELYADRDVLLAARTSGGGIMAGLASRAHTSPHVPSDVGVRSSSSSSNDDDDADASNGTACAVRKRVALDERDTADDKDESDIDVRRRRRQHTPCDAVTCPVTAAAACRRTQSTGTCVTPLYDRAPCGREATAYTALMRHAAAALCTAHGVGEDSARHDAGNRDECDDARVVHSAIAAAATADAATSARLQAMPITTATALQHARATYASLLPLHDQLHEALQQQQQQRKLSEGGVGNRGAATTATMRALYRALHTTLYTLERDIADYVDLHYYGVV